MDECVTFHIFGGMGPEKNYFVTAIFLRCHIGYILLVLRQFLGTLSISTDATIAVDDENSP